MLPECKTLTIKQQLDPVAWQWLGKYQALYLGNGILKLLLPTRPRLLNNYGTLSAWERGGGEREVCCGGHAPLRYPEGLVSSYLWKWKHCVENDH